MLGELIDLVSGIGIAEEADRSRDILRRVYECFLGGFAGAEGKRGSEFYTPPLRLRLLVEMPYSAESMTPAAAPAVCVSSPRSWSRNTAGTSGTSPSTVRRATIRPRGLPNLGHLSCSP